MIDQGGRVTDILKGAVEMHLRYTATIVNLATGYVSDLGELLRDGAASPASGVVTQAAEGPAPTQPTRRPPILLVGQLDEEVSGAFALNNTTGIDLSVNLAVQGDIDPTLAEVIPSVLKLAAGAGTFVRLKVRITGALAENRDYRAAVFAPDLPVPPVEFVVRRLSANG
jgi:hypothetical protein